MRFPVVAPLLVGSVLLTTATAQQQADPSFDTRNNNIIDALSMNDDTSVASHHLLMPLFSPLREVLDDKSQTYTVFVPSNKAKREELQWVDEMLCEDRDAVRTDEKLKRRAKKQLKEVWGRREWRKLVHLTDEDCENLSRLIELDEKVVRDVDRLRVSGADVKTLKRQLKTMLRENESEYKQIRFSPEVEKYLLAISAYAVVPQRVDTATIEPGSKQTFTTLLSKPELLPLDGYESNTKLVLKKGREGRVKIVFASPRAPFWKVRFDEQPIEAVNGLIYVTRHSVPYPHTLSKSLIYNKLFLTHALLSYTGLLDKLSERKALTVIAPTNEAWMKVLPQMVDKATIRRMARQVQQRYNLMKQLPFYKQFKHQQQEDAEERIRRSAKESAEPEYLRMEAESPKVEIDEVEPEAAFESAQTRHLFTRLNKRALRSLLLSHILPAVHFSDELTRLDTITAMSGANLKVKSDVVEDKFTIGKSRTVFSDIPIKQGAMHVVDDIATPIGEIRFRFAARQHV